LELVRRCVSGDSAAWDEFVERYTKLVYYAICQTLRRRRITVEDDLLGEIHNGVFLSLLEDDFRRLRAFSGRSKLTHWLKVVTVNRTIDFLRRRKHNLRLDEPVNGGPAIVDTLVHQGVDPEEAAMRAQRAQVLSDAVKTLPEHDQVLLRLLYIEGEPGEVVARILGTTVGAIYTRKSRLRKRLVKLLAPSGER
jgi:RNA polymerase sigma factor (sigma-70 family)